MFYLDGIGSIILAIEIFYGDIRPVIGAVTVGVAHPFQFILKEDQNSKLQQLSLLPRSLVPVF